MEQAIIDELVYGCAYAQAFDGNQAGVDLDGLAARDERVAEALVRARKTIREIEAGPEGYAEGEDAWYQRFD